MGSATEHAQTRWTRVGGALWSPRSQALWLGRSVGREVGGGTWALHCWGQQGRSPEGQISVLPSCPPGPDPDLSTPPRTVVWGNVSHCGEVIW